MGSPRRWRGTGLWPDSPAERRTRCASQRQLWWIHLLVFLGERGGIFLLVSFFFRSLLLRCIYWENNSVLIACRLAHELGNGSLFLTVDSLLHPSWEAHCADTTAVFSSWIDERGGRGSVGRVGELMIEGLAAQTLAPWARHSTLNCSQWGWGCLAWRQEPHRSSWWHTATHCGHTKSHRMCVSAPKRHPPPLPARPWMRGANSRPNKRLRGCQAEPFYTVLVPRACQALKNVCKGKSSRWQLDGNLASQPPTPHPHPANSLFETSRRLLFLLRRSSDEYSCSCVFKVCFIEAKLSIKVDRLQNGRRAQFVNCGKIGSSAAILVWGKNKRKMFQYCHCHFVFCEFFVWININSIIFHCFAVLTVHIYPMWNTQRLLLPSPLVAQAASAQKSSFVVLFTLLKYNILIMQPKHP